MDKFASVFIESLQHVEVSPVIKRCVPTKYQLNTGHILDSFSKFMYHKMQKAILILLYNVSMVWTKYMLLLKM